MALSAGVTPVEHPVDTHSLPGRGTFLRAARLPVRGASGAPARAFALEGPAT